LVALPEEAQSDKRATYGLFATHPASLNADYICRQRKADDRNAGVRVV